MKNQVGAHHVLHHWYSVHKDSLKFAGYATDKRILDADESLELIKGDNLLTGYRDQISFSKLYGLLKFSINIIYIHNM